MASARAGCFFVLVLGLVAVVLLRRLMWKLEEAVGMLFLKVEEFIWLIKFKV